MKLLKKSVKSVKSVDSFFEIEVPIMDTPTKNKSRRGTMVVEAALILPLLLLLTFGGLKYGWLFIKWQQINNVARHSVRYAVRPSPTNPTPSALISTLMSDADMPNYTLVELTSGAPVGSPVVVQIDVAVADIDILKMPLLPTPTTLSARMTMSKEGP